jgi:hypothetical protein
MEQIDKRTPETVDSNGHYNVELALARILQHLIQRRALVASLCAADPGVLVYLDHLPSATLRNGFQFNDLVLDGLVIRADANVQRGAFSSAHDGPFHSQRARIIAQRRVKSQRFLRIGFEMVKTQAFCGIRKRHFGRAFYAPPIAAHGVLPDVRWPMRFASLVIATHRRVGSSLAAALRMSCVVLLAWRDAVAGRVARALPLIPSAQSRTMGAYPARGRENRERARRPAQWEISRRLRQNSTPYFGNPLVHS